MVSPDGTSVAFTAQQGSLETVSLLGGPPFTVVSSGVPNRGVDWGSDGMLYFTNSEGVIQRVPASGGEPERVTTNEPGTDHFWVDALPEGRGLLFTIMGGTASQSEIAVVGFGDGEVRTLLPGAMARYASSGHIVYAVADGTLMAAPFDLGPLEVTGPSVGLLENVSVGGASSGRFALSETGTLLYATGGSFAANLVPVWVERDGTAREIDPGWRTAGDNVYSSLALSPDGTRLAISAVGSDGRYDLWVKQLDTGPLSRLTFEGTQNRRATWSEDGESLTFISNRAGSNHVWTKRVDGSGAAELVLDWDGAIEALYSPDRTCLVLRGGDTNSGLGDIYGIRPGVDSVAVPLVATEFAEFTPAISRDGRWLAYASRASGREEIYVRPFPDVDSGMLQVSANGGRMPVWGHSGQELFYLADDPSGGSRQLVAVQFTGDPTFVAGRQDVLFSVGGYLNGYHHYDPSPDDQLFAMLRVGEQGTSPEFILIQNFFEELKERVPN